MFNKSETSLTIDDVCQLSRDMHKKGKIVGFTHGAYDMFHVGHLGFLRETKRKCDVLIVGIESDKNIASYKGVLRPIIEEHDRAKIVNCISYVSVAYINYLPVNRDTFKYLYKEIHPDFVSIGRQINDEKIIEALVKSQKLKLLKIEEEFGTSTSKIIERVVSRYRTVRLGAD